jgi:hypothetical protein
MQKTARTIREIIDAAGGRNAVAAALYAAGQGLTTGAIHKWEINGIHDRYWKVVMPLANATPEELFQANEMLRQQRAA